MKSAEELMRITLKRGLSPVPKLRVSEWADKYRQLPSDAAEPGRWRTSRTPYMRAVMDAFTEPNVYKVVVKSAAQVGKALATNTPIATVTGWKTMGELEAGDRVFDECGVACKVVDKSEVFFDHDCYELTFSDGAKIIADAAHVWQFYDVNTKRPLKMTTWGMIYSQIDYEDMMFVSINPHKADFDVRFLKTIRAVESVPTQCIAVDSPSHLYLAGREMIPTHNSEVLLNVIGRYAQVDPATIMIIQPTLEMSQDFSKSRLSKMISDTKVLTRLFYGAKETSETRNGNQTILSKFYVGGRVVLAGANSPAGLASRPIRILLCDEIDRWPMSAGAEGDPLSIAEKRTSTYFSRKVGIFSTPTVLGISRIDQEYELGTRESWAHACPNCGEYHVVEYADIDECLKWRCPDCGLGFSEEEVKSAKQKYIASNPAALDAGIRSFYITGFYSPWVEWSTIRREYEEARGKPDLEKVVCNTRFGLSYDRPGDVGDETYLMKRLESYEEEVPSGVMLLTAGVDVQANRLEYEIVGWGVEEESWGIRRGQIMKSPQDPEAWCELDAVLDRDYRSSEGRLKVLRTFVDSGYMTSEVYEYCQRRAELGRFAIKGYGTPGRALIYKTEIHKGLALILLGVNEGKAMIYARLTLKEPGAQYMHYGRDDEYMVRRYDEVYFKQLMAERRVIRRTGGMLYETYEPVSRRQRNEALDLRVYALAALKSLGEIDWEKSKSTSERKKRRVSVEAEIW